MTDPGSRRPAEVCWVAAHESPYGFEVLDCRPLSETAIATSGNPRIAARFAGSRSSGGEENRGRTPDEPFPVACTLDYPAPPDLKEGAVFIAPEMEHKWDVFFRDGALAFARSWTGELMIVADFVTGGATARVRSITAHSRQALGDTAFTTRVVDFLLKSYLYGLEAPHPLPAHYRDRPPDDLAAFSFSQFGRIGRFGTFEDTTRLRVVRGASNRPGLRKE